MVEAAAGPGAGARTEGERAGAGTPRGVWGLGPGRLPSRLQPSARPRRLSGC